MREAMLGVAAEGPYARYWRPELAPLPEEVIEALARGARPAELFAGPEDAAAMLEGEAPVETGWSWTRAGGARVFCRTRMPRVTPAMWDWWFGWHGSEAERYRLWHPQAHVSAAWADGEGETGDYVGRTSLVTEYLGASPVRVAIRFVAPAEFGVDERRLAALGQAMVCARVGLQGSPVESGAMIHQLRPIPGGCEMRSRFWLFGEQLRLGRWQGPMGRLLARLVPVRPAQAEALLVHCAEEMNHLATFLPELHAEFGGAR
ncbi:hypothetical protein [Sphingomonas sp.]|uniref:DAPG hydrolase family protein n=1 Tax=Sphingomonas sp. TaxID=28214 RepID=UPI001B2B5E2C|nr:hypothetical protein [Sphingomonas sp.]MBO9711521.1 hypothetical protein [Sphingomonas sp.]